MVRLGLLSLLGWLGSLAAVRYGDYAVADMRHMPQYEQRDAADGGDGGDGGDEYGDRSLDSPARPDYKYEEAHEHSEDILGKDIYEDKIWEKSMNKIRKPSYNQNDRNFNVDKNRFDDEVVVKSKDRLLNRRSRVRNNNFETKSLQRLKYNSLPSIDSDTDNEDSKKIYKEGLDRGDEFEEINLPRHRMVTQKKVRRKPRDRALHHLERNTKRLRFEEEDVVTKPGRGHSRHLNTERIDISESAKQNTNYDEYYDMNRVQNIKDRLPALLRQKTVRTTGPQSTGDLESWFNRHVALSEEYSTSESEVLTNATTSTTTPASTPMRKKNVTVRVGNSSDLSPDEKSGFLIVKTAGKDSGGQASWSSKPPVLLQVTQRLQAAVSVERQESARDPSVDTPQRRKRARALLRRKLVDSARSIHDLTDDWDRMVCDYIDVALLDANHASVGRHEVLLVCCCSNLVFILFTLNVILEMLV